MNDKNNNNKKRKLHFFFILKNSTKYAGNKKIYIYKTQRKMRTYDGQEWLYIDIYIFRFGENL